MENIRLLYIDIRGLMEPTRWMLRISGINFIDDRIPLAQWAVKGKKDQLLRRRKSSIEGSSAGRFVGQLPVLFYGDNFTLTQPLAVLRFLARKCGLQGDTPMEEARAEEVSDIIYDLRLRAAEYEGKAFKSNTPDVVRHTVFRDFYNSPSTPAKEKMREDFKMMHFPLYFTKFNDLLESSEGEWIGGVKMTYGDLVLANFLDIAEDLVDPDCLAEFPKLRELKEKVFAIPEIIEWRTGQGQIGLVSNTLQP